MDIEPPIVQTSFALLRSAGLFLIINLVAGGAQGAPVTGTHGAGVGVPRAAAVNAITAGFVFELHMPNGKMFFIGMLSIIVAAGLFAALVRFSGVTINVLGAAPMLHIIMAPIVTSCGMMFLLYL